MDETIIERLKSMYEPPFSAHKGQLLDSRDRVVLMFGGNSWSVIREIGDYFARKLNEDCKDGTADKG